LYLKVSILLLFCIFQTKAVAQILQRDSTKKKEGIFILPLIYYTPDTRFAAGAMGVYYFRTGKNESDSLPITRLSYIKLLADYTQNRQLDIWSAWNIFTDKERFLFKGDLRYRNFPDRFYGVGNNTLQSQVEFYSYDFVSAKFLALKNLGYQAFWGLDYQFSYQYNFKYDQNSQLLKNGLVTGYDGGLASAFGLVFTFDTRDNVVNAHNGFLLEASSYFNKPVFGSDFSYNNINLTFNRYISLKPNHVLAFNTVANFNTNGVPFIEMAKVGNDDILRGYARNRFRDLNYIASQAEYRFPLWKRVGGVLFAGAGDVFRTTSDLKWELLKYTYGGGLRFAINKAERLNVRFDYGFGRGEQSFYITLTEAF